MFRQGFTCPALLKDHQKHYAYGAITHYGRPSRPLGFSSDNHWPVPLSLATTRGISVDVFSSRY